MRIRHRLPYRSIKLPTCLLTLLLCGLLFSSQESSGQEELILVDSGFIFSDPPFQSCHASTLAVLPDHKIIAAWFAGKQEGSPDVSIWTAVMDKDVWSLPKETANGIQKDGIRFACWNPVLFTTRSGLLILFYKVGSSPRTWWGEMKTSADHGRSWSEVQKLPDGFLGPVKNKPVQLINGDILCPSSTESISGNQWRVHMERCDSVGKSWEKISVDCDSFQAIQPTVLTYKNGNMQLLCRTRNNVIAQSWSYDGGTSWIKMSPTELPNPNSGIDAVSLENGMQLLVYNPLPHGEEWWEGRAVLRLAVSADGKGWRDLFTLEQHRLGEYSYPAVIRGNEGEVYISYTYLRKRIKFVRLRLTLPGDP